MAYNDVTALYTAHQASPVEPEIDDACAAVADMLATVLGPLPLHRPLKGASGAAIATPPQLPYLVVLPGAQPGSEEALNAIQVGTWHYLDLVFLFAPAGQPVETAVLANLDYLYAVQLAISANRNVGDGVRRLGITGWEWARVDYAGQAWGGLVVHTRLQLIYGLRAAW